MADCLLLTKRDLVDAEQAAALEQRLQRINPAARRLEARHGQVDAADILGLGLFSTNAKIPDVARWLNEEAYGQAHDPHASHSPRSSQQADTAGASGQRDHQEHDHHNDHDHDHGHAHDVNRRQLPRPEGRSLKELG
ncbi:hypothetical protein [Halochromatium glycolicum]|uniref:hypothetical protein n=1 Tax=Halochromatium glycolicum TaxID=85075 RepID=UPI001F5BF11E|nr:hypothetical protein [Halochromatium glycolicum]